MKTKKIIFNVMQLLVSLFLCLGVKFLFHACEASEDGSFMACHWAEQAVFGVSIILCVQSVLLFLIKSDLMRRGFLCAMAVTAALPLFIPGVLVNLCMMTGMQCHIVMRPAVLVTTSVLLIILALHLLLVREK